MEIGFKHWFSVLSIAALIHAYAALNVNLTGFTAESKHPFNQYTVDLTTLALPPKQLKLETFKPAPPKQVPAPKTITAAKSKPKPIPKPVKPKIVAPKVEKPKEVVRPELEKPVQDVEVTPEETQFNEVPQPVPQPPAPQPARASTVQSSTSTVPAGTTPRPGSETGRPGYYQLILEKLERLKKYPSRARRRGQQGTVVLSFTLNRDGSLKHYEITKSSGVKSLDLAVKKLIRRATFPAIPKNISSDTLEVSVPISFSLQ